MSDQEGHHPEILNSETLIPPGKVRDVEGLRVTWSIIIAVMSLLIGVAFLSVSLCLNHPELVTWSTGLISAIAGSAISYGFTGQRRQ